MPFPSIACVCKTLLLYSPPKSPSSRYHFIVGGGVAIKVKVPIYFVVVWRNNRGFCVAARRRWFKIKDRDCNKIDFMGKTPIGIVHCSGRRSLILNCLVAGRAMWHLLTELPCPSSSSSLPCRLCHTLILVVAAVVNYQRWTSVSSSYLIAGRDLDGWSIKCTTTLYVTSTSHYCPLQSEDLQPRPSHSFVVYDDTTV